jgi:hypothetical protein
MNSKRWFNATTALMAGTFFAIFTLLAVPNLNANMQLNKAHKAAGLNCGKCHHKPDKHCGNCHASGAMKDKLHAKCKSCHKSSQKAKIGGLLKAGSKCKKCHK